jgi:hypothetical protein
MKTRFSVIDLDREVGRQEETEKAVKGARAGWCLIIGVKFPPHRKHTARPYKDQLVNDIQDKFTIFRIAWFLRKGSTMAAQDLTLHIQPISLQW